MNATRQCRRCNAAIPVGRWKVGRVIFPGGVCYPCWVHGGRDRKARRKTA